MTLRGDAAAAIGGALFLGFLVLLAADLALLVGLAGHVSSSKRSKTSRRILVVISSPLVILESAFVWSLSSGGGHSELNGFALVFAVSVLVKVWLCIAAWLKPLSGAMPRRTVVVLTLSFVVALGVCVTVLEFGARPIRTSHSAKTGAPATLLPPLEDELDGDGGT